MTRGWQVVARVACTSRSAWSVVFWQTSYACPFGERERESGGPMACAGDNRGCVLTGVFQATLAVGAPLFQSAPRRPCAGALL